MNRICFGAAVFCASGALAQASFPTAGGGGAGLTANTFTATQTITPAANVASLVMSPPVLTTGTTGFGESITGTVNSTAGAVDGAMSFANITCSPSCPAGFLLADWKLNGASKFQIDQYGNLYTGSLQATANVFANTATGAFGIGSRSYITSPFANGWQLGSTDGVTGLSQVLTAQGGAAGQTNVVGGNLTLQAGNTTGNAAAPSLIFKSPKSDGTSSGTTQQTQVVGFIVVDGAAKLSSYTVAGLPTGTTVGAGAMAFVTDSSATMTTGIGATVTGGGSYGVKVYYDGAGWRIG